MPRRLSLSLSLALCAALSCTSGTQPQAPRSDYRATPPAQVGSTAVLTDYEQPQTLHPLLARTDGELRAGTLLFATLWGLGPDLKPYPDLARTVPAPENGAVRTQRGGRTMTVDVRLVAGLRWSDGQPITADDVIFTWHALQAPSLRAAAPPGLEHVTGMARRSVTEVVWTFDTTYPAYVQLGARMFLLPAHRLAAVAPGALAADAFFQRPDVVSGPFAVAESVPDHLTLAANPRYAAGRAARGAYPGGDGPFDHAPYLQRVVLETAASRQVEVQTVLAQGADLALHLQPADLTDLHGATGSAPRVTTGLRQELLAPSHDPARAVPWAADPKVLRALDEALDRAGLVHDLLAGAGRPARGLYPSALAGIAKGSPLHAGPDAAAAARLLDEDGWTAGADGVRVRQGRRLTFTLTTICDRPGARAELDLLQRQWLAVGAAVSTGCLARDVFLERAAAGDLDMALYSDSRGSDPAAWTAAGTTGGADNWGRCSDRALDADLARAGSTLDRSARLAAARAAERDWLAARCTLPLFELPDVRQVSTRLRNLVPDAAAADTWNAADWWLAAT